MAEARSAVSEPRVSDLEEGHNAKLDFLRAWRKAFFRRFFRTRNMIRNGMWPTSIYNLGIGVALFSASVIGDWKWLEPVNSRLWSLSRTLHIHDGIPYPLRVLMISSAGGLVFFVIVMYKRRWLLRILLSYRGWMYEAPRTQSWSTMIWGAVVRLVSGYHPTTYSYQKSLPFLPVPPLNKTISNFVSSVRPLYGENSEEFAKIAKDAEEFKTGIGPRLQKILVLKSWWAQNWVTDWWEKYVYLMGRSPIAINSNYYILDHGHWSPTRRQVSRAASTIYNYMVCKRQIDREELVPLVIRKTIPLCMAQYERVFSTTRVPGENVDELVKFSTSKHLIVNRQGLYYVLDVYDVEGNPLNQQSLEKQLQWIVDDADKHTDAYNDGSRNLAALTGIDRTEWAQIRSEHLTSGINKDSLHLMESALFHVVLETRSFDSWSERGGFLMHGDGRTVWFDKSFNAIFFSDGRSGLNCEHAWGDAPVMAHISEYNLTNEVLGDLFDKDGYCRPTADVSHQANMRNPSRLVWEIQPKLAAGISRAVETNVKNNEDLDLMVVEHNSYGKGFIKTCKVSPDAYIQAALQLAYYKENGEFALTYESSMTRLYLLGRTETVRSLTNECADFVKAMVNKGSSTEEKIALLTRACQVHQKLYRDAMAGKGIDRHMFGLFVVAKGFGYESEFLKDSLMMPWTLSTSQQPQQQIAASPDCSKPEFRDKVCPGGGFGPVSDKGYGVSYMVPDDSVIFFHVSSKKSCAKTDSRHFVSLLFESLAEMKALF